MNPFGPVLSPSFNPLARNQQQLSPSLTNVHQQHQRNQPLHVHTHQHNHHAHFPSSIDIGQPPRSAPIHAQQFQHSQQYQTQQPTPVSATEYDEGDEGGADDEDDDDDDDGFDEDDEMIAAAMLVDGTVNPNGAGGNPYPQHQRRARKRSRSGPVMEDGKPQQGVPGSASVNASASSLSPAALLSSSLPAGVGAGFAGHLAGGGLSVSNASSIEIGHVIIAADPLARRRKSVVPPEERRFVCQHCSQAFVQ
ncbi:hypothetical protein HK101_000402, partial [Irineochytrium annulatum]